MTDFLDLLEADLREAAERRGRPQPHRRRPPKGAFKAVTVMAAVALFVVAAARIVNRADVEHPAQPTPTPTATPPVGPHVKMVVATEGNPGLLDVMSATLGGYMALDRDSGGLTADGSLGTVVLYRPDSEGAKDAADMAAFIERIDEVRPFTAAEARAFDGDPDVVVAYGAEREQQMLDDPKICAPAGGDYKVCLSRSDETRYSALVHDGKVALSTTGPPEPWWSWAALSPDGKSILIEASNRCEFSQAWVWDAQMNGGESVTFGVAQPLGWTTDGRVIVFVPQPRADAAQHCRAELPPGLYLVKPGDEPTRIGDNDVPRSIDARTPEEVSQAAG
jgi:hypothetical protein